jgi:hypothetical protein
LTSFVSLKLKTCYWTFISTAFKTCLNVELYWKLTIWIYTHFNGVTCESNYLISTNMNFYFLGSFDQAECLCYQAKSMGSWI